MRQKERLRVDLYVGPYGPGPVRPSWRPPPLGRRPLKEKSKRTSRQLGRQLPRVPLARLRPTLLPSLLLCSPWLRRSPLQNPNPGETAPQLGAGPGAHGTAESPLHSASSASPVAGKASLQLAAHLVLPSVSHLAILVVDWLLSYPFRLLITLSLERWLAVGSPV